MGNKTAQMIDSPLGQQQIDTIGPPVGVVRMDVDKAYAGIGELLPKV